MSWKMLFDLSCRYKLASCSIIRDLWYIHICKWVYIIPYKIMSWCILQRGLRCKAWYLCSACCSGCCDMWCGASYSVLYGNIYFYRWSCDECYNIHDGQQYHNGRYDVCGGKHCYSTQYSGVMVYIVRPMWCGGVRL